MLAREGQPLFSNQTLDINPWEELQSNDVLNPENTKVPDFFFTNLESPLGANVSELNDMNLCSGSAQVKVLVQGGVDLVSLANNHSDDCSANGVNSTKQVLEAEGIHFAVMGGEPTLLDIPGSKMAVIAADDVTGKLDVQDLLTIISNAHNEFQVVVVSIHWGNEYQAGPDERQQSLAQQMADAGADVIWGHHPHVLQKMEWLTSADDRQVLVMYSLGNLLADQWMLEDAQQSALVRLKFKNGEIRRIEVNSLVMDRASKTLQISSDTPSIERTTDRLGLEDLALTKVEIQLLGANK